jgi:hypothetical protein
MILSEVRRLWCELEQLPRTAVDRPQYKALVRKIRKLTDEWKARHRG